MRFTTITRCCGNLFAKQLDIYAQYNPSPLSMDQFLKFGRAASESDSFCFLQKELPVRYANITKEINLLPSSLLQMPSVALVQEWYYQSFCDLCEFEGIQDATSSSLSKFCQTLKVIHDRHAKVVETMAQGVLELKDLHALDAQTEHSIQYFLDRFYMSRISLKMLMDQHSLLFDSDDDSINKTRIGNIDPKANVKSIIKEAFKNASFLCEEYYDVAPDIDITVANVNTSESVVEVAYPPPHLYHILFELFKNSMRAIIESNQNNGNIPDISVLIAKGPHDVSIKISDEGGGIPRHITESLFCYLFSTAPRPSSAPTKAPLAGYGFGLPLSRLYARYFHGDLILNSYEGFGTDAVIYLRSMTHEAFELLPVFNKASTKQYKSSVLASDWTDSSSSIGRSHSPFNAVVHNN